MGLESVELILAFEEEFEISFSDTEAQSLSTPRSVTELIYAKLNSPDFKGMRKGWALGRILEEVRKIICEQLGLKDFSDDANFYNDLI